MERLKNLNCDQPELFVASQWQHNKKSPNLKYLIYRWTLASYFTFVVILSLITAAYCNQVQFYLIYLTNWNVLMNGAQSLLAACLVTRFYRRKIHFDNDINSMSHAFKILWLLSTVSTVLAVSLSTVYWPIIHTGRDNGLNDALTHAGNAIVLLIDLFVHAHPPRFSHVVYPFAFGILYIAFSVVYTISGGTDRDYNNYIYSVIDWKMKTMDACLFATAIVVFSSLMHFVMTGLIKLRIFICQRLSMNQRESNNATFSVNSAYEP